MGKSAEPRDAAPLSESLNRHLNLYALAASGAGVGILALSPPAEAKIVYTKTHLVVHAGTDLDVNNRGVADYSFRSYPDCPSGGPLCVTYRKIVPLNGNSVEVKSGFPGALPKGALIGPQNSWGAKPGVLAYVVFSGSEILRYSGNWVDVRNHYLGLQFSINGQPHYGWARLNLSFTTKDKGGITATITGYAYETVPNNSIVAGKTKGPDVITLQPGTLGALAAGSSRRRK